MNAGYGWDSDLGTLVTAEGDHVIRALQSFVKDASRSQVSAWKDQVGVLQTEGREALRTDAAAAQFRSILEYQLPMEARRPDVILLENGNVLVLEFKSKDIPTSADIDQVSAYARDLHCYHRECRDRHVRALLVPVRYKGPTCEVSGTYVVNPDQLAELITKLSQVKAAPLTRDAFLSETAYSPLPSLVRAARELFESKTVRPVWRASASTDPVVELISHITHEAAATKTRRLILLTGVPGSGKTLVGLRAVHAGYLDDLAVDREGARPTAPAVYLSGNDPLVSVLQYELRRAGGGGRTFVRAVRSYVERYSRANAPVPPEHFLVFDEAQRAWDATRVEKQHPGVKKSEPELFIDFAERIPQWCVVLGLIGTGQEINTGEEAGIAQWRTAIEKSARAKEWAIHAPPRLAEHFAGSTARFDPTLNLEAEIRFHLVTQVHAFVDGLLSERLPKDIPIIGEQLRQCSYPIYVTRDLEKAKKYVRERYHEDPAARYGLLASARDKELPACGIRNQWQDRNMMKVGPWFSEGDESAHSCRQLLVPATEFQAQGLELDYAIVCWGSDFLRENGKWSNRFARGYERGASIKDPFQLRLNSYRVLLTRGRDGMILFVPPMTKWDETFNHFKSAGVVELIE